MYWLKTARLIFCIAALIFVAKPFIGFSLTDHLKTSAKTNILVKIFSKRKIEDIHSEMNTIRQMLSSASDSAFPRFVLLLSLIFPLTFLLFNEGNNKLLSRLQLRLVPQPLTVANSQFRI